MEAKDSAGGWQELCSNTSHSDPDQATPPPAPDILSLKVCISCLIRLKSSFILSRLRDREFTELLHMLIAFIISVSVITFSLF